MFMRRRRPLARAAMVGGAAYYTGKRVQEGREDDAYRDARLDQLEAQQAQGARKGVGCRTARSSSSRSLASSTTRAS